MNFMIICSNLLALLFFTGFNLIDLMCPKLKDSISNTIRFGCLLILLFCFINYLFVLYYI